MGNRWGEWKKPYQEAGEGAVRMDCLIPGMKQQLKDVSRRCKLRSELRWRRQLSIMGNRWGEKKWGEWKKPYQEAGEGGVGMDCLIRGVKQPLEDVSC
jgi:hypothetical protein